MSFVHVLDRIADVAQQCRGAPNSTLIGAYVRAARKFCRETRWYRATVTGQTEAGTRSYSLGSDTYLEILGLRAVSADQDGQTWALAPADTTAWNPNRGQGRPAAFSYIPEGQVALDPIPDDVYGLTCTLVLQPKEGATQVPDSLLVKWDQALQDGALAYLLDLHGMPWTDKAAAELKRRAFQSAINNARADEQREFNTGPTFIKRRRFVTGSPR